MYRVPLFDTTLAKYKIIWSSLNFSFVKPDTTVSYLKYMEFSSHTMEHVGISYRHILAIDFTCSMFCEVIE